MNNDTETPTKQPTQSKGNLPDVFEPLFNLLDLQPSQLQRAFGEVEVGDVTEILNDCRSHLDLLSRVWDLEDEAGDNYSSMRFRYDWEGIEIS